MLDAGCWILDDETIDHLENLFEAGSLKNELIYNNPLYKKLEELGLKMNNFIPSVERSHNPYPESSV